MGKASGFCRAKWSDPPTNMAGPMLPPKEIHDSTSRQLATCHAAAIATMIPPTPPATITSTLAITGIHLAGSSTSSFIFQRLDRQFGATIYHFISWLAFSEPDSVITTPVFFPIYFTTVVRSRYLMPLRQRFEVANS
ncbi:TPA: hypothetical protein EYN09_23330 [Candidatus Poribacteria bacterium]|nr:hypothetical protein [Candidatus Poribacteria bacterium]